MSTSVPSADLRPRPEVGRPLEWTFPAATRTVLDSGLTLLVVDLPGKALPTAQLLIDLPVSADPEGREGAAVLAGQALDEGTEVRDAEEFAEALEGLGASFYGSAGGDGLRAGVQAPVRQLAAAIELAAEALRVPAFPAGEISRLRASRLDNLEQERANPAARARMAYRSAAYAEGERSRISDGGDAVSVALLDRDLVAELYTARSHPALATLVLAGDLGGADPLALAAAFDGWGRGRPAPEPATVRPAKTVDGARVIIVDKPGAVQTELLLGHPSIDRLHPDWAAMMAVAWTLGGTLTSRIDTVLREEKGYTYGMRAGMEPRRNGATFSVHGSVDTANTGAAVDDLVRVLRTAVEGGFTDAERLSTADYLAGVAPLNYETPEAVAAHLLMVQGMGLPEGWLDAHLARLRSLTLDDLNRTCAEHVRMDSALLVAVGDASVIAGPLRDAGLGEVEVVPN